MPSTQAVDPIARALEPLPPVDAEAVCRRVVNTLRDFDPAELRVWCAAVMHLMRGARNPAQALNEACEKLERAKGTR